VLTSGVFQDEFMRTPLTDYADEAGYWFSDYDTIYVRYVSDDAASAWITRSGRRPSSST
jgi:hypothetical protein